MIPTCSYVMNCKVIDENFIKVVRAIFKRDVRLFIHQIFQFYMRNITLI